MTYCSNNFCLYDKKWNATKFYSFFPWISNLMSSSGRNVISVQKVKGWKVKGSSVFPYSQNSATRSWIHHWAGRVCGLSYFVKYLVQCLSSHHTCNFSCFFPGVDRVWLANCVVTDLIKLFSFLFIFNSVNSQTCHMMSYCWILLQGSYRNWANKIQWLFHDFFMTN